MIRLPSLSGLACGLLASTSILATSAHAQSADIDAALAAARDAINTPGFSGAVVVLQDGEPILAEARGLADQETGRPNTLETRFNIASVGKYITAAAYYRAAAQSGISDFAAHSPGETLTEHADLFSEDLTVGDLMAHRTTAESFFAQDDAETRMLEAGSNADVLDMVITAQDGAIARRTDGLAYNNSNAIITGEVTARLMETSYEDAVQTLVFGPAGVESPAFVRLSQAREFDLALPYVPEGFDPESMMRPEPGAPLPDSYPVRGDSPLAESIPMAAGGLYMTAGDLAQIGAATLDGRVLTREQTAELCTSQLPLPGLILGLGCGGRDHGPGQLRWGHNGGAPGINTELSVFPEQNLVLAVVSNHQRRATPVMEAFEQALFSLDPEAGGGRFVVR